MRIHSLLAAVRFTLGILAFALTGSHAFAKTPAHNPSAVTPQAAAQAVVAPVPNLEVASFTPPQLEARAWILYDVNAHQVLTAKDPNTVVEPASLTKLMTAYLVFESLKEQKITLTQTLPISKAAAAKEGSRMFVPAGAQIPVEDLIKGMIVQSGNDATNALAEGLGGGSIGPFVERMNAKAKALGMNNTQFRNPEGLTSEGHTSTVHDLLILSKRLLQDYPDRVGYYAIKNYAYPGTPASNSTNRNMLLFSDPSVGGLKTGHTEKAGYNLIATAKRDAPDVGSRRLISVVVGTQSEKARAAESEKLLNWGYSAFDMLKFAEPNQVLKTQRVWMGDSNEAKLGLDHALWVATPKGKKAQTTITIQTPQKQIFAPLIQGQDMGNVEVKVDNQNFISIPLQVLEDVGEAGFIGQLWDKAHLWLAGKVGQLLGWV